MGTEVLRPHDCLARARPRRPLRPAGRRTAAAARQGQGHGHGHGARGDRRGGPSAAVTAPRQARTKAKAKAAAPDAYAGPAFGAMSPSPRELPLPRFPSRMAADAAVPGAHDAATRELRRLLGLH